jgi:hypothetical protein
VAVTAEARRPLTETREPLRRTSGGQKVWKERLQIYHRQLGFAAANDSNKQLWRSWTGVISTF